MGRILLLLWSVILAVRGDLYEWLIEPRNNTNPEYEVIILNSVWNDQCA